MRLAGHIAVITGAASGIGRACVDLFLREGAGVALLDRCHSSLPDAARCVATTVDVASAEEVHGAAEMVRNKLGEPNILVNCAAATAFADTLSTTEADFRSVFDVNVLGILNICQAFVPAMRDRKCGSIVNVSSITGIVGAPGLSAYSASKGAIITLTRTMALEFAESSIRVNCVCPASVDTPLLQASFDRTADPARARELNIKRHPLGHLGKPEDVANLILFLASDEASWITGGTYVIDGGASIARRWQE
jgi:NAD(P)-dependent dehydrogenase (short-subunit alcohol dehydrogenase family)